MNELKRMFEMGIINFDSEIIFMKEIDGKMIVKCKSPIYEIRKNKNGKLYKVCLTNKCRTENIMKLINEMDEKDVSDGN